MRAPIEIELATLAALSSMDRIDFLCDRFEDAWRKGCRPDLRMFLEYASNEQEKFGLFRELLPLDIEYRRRQGEPAEVHDYRASYGDFAAAIHAVELTSDEPAATQPLGNPEPLAGDLPRLRQVAHFRLQCKLGEGGNGEVWKAWDERLQRYVALKILRGQQPTDAERQRFLREARAAAQVQHPRILPVYDIGRQDGLVYIVAELIDGVDLRQFLQPELPPFREAARLGAEVAGAVEHAHRAGIVHRDLKPANILLDRWDNPYVADFGIAKWSADVEMVTMPGEIIGTPPYMAPEQARGDTAAVGPRSDVYALGAILYQMLTGRPPFAGDCATILYSVVHAEPVAPRLIRRNVPRDLETICLKAMRKEPNERYATAAEMAADLRRLLDGEPILARRENVVAYSWRKLRRRPMSVAALMLLIGLIAASAVAWSLAEENRELSGIRTVALTTHPSGAEMTFIPLNKLTGEPEPERAVRSQGLSPAKVKLSPADYLVVAVLPGTGRFHEVFRRVPGSNDTVTQSYSHLHWKMENGLIKLADIRIPAANNVSRMAYIAAGPIDASWTETKQTVTKSAWAPAFLADPYEFSIRQYRELNQDKLPLDVRWDNRPDDFALTINFDLAVSLAERVGKRLPTMAELQRLANLAVQQQGERTLTDQDKQTVGPVGSPNWDRLDTTPPLYGAVSNVREWSTTRPAGLHRADGLLNLPGVHGEDYRVVMHGAKEGRLPRNLPGADMVGVSRFAVEEDLGFRCVRSLRPRLTRKDFFGDTEQQSQSNRPLPVEISSICK